MNVNKRKIEASPLMIFVVVIVLFIAWFVWLSTPNKSLRNQGISQIPTSSSNNP